MKKSKILTLLSLLMLNILGLKAQTTPTDSTAKTLEQITVLGYKEQAAEVQRLSQIHATYIISGKKNEVINVTDLNTNISEKTGRQIFAKIPGVFIYDMDGSGNQINIATRGLDPHRSWEYNVRQNGVIMNSDIYGYPASHYSPPLESIQKIEMVHGTAGLQYGAQFGGMINYVTKTGDTTKALSYEGSHSVGSFGLFSSFNSVSGKIGKLQYYAYYHKRVSDGYRKNGHSEAEAQFAALTYRFSPSLSLKAELGRSTYTYQLPGPMTDAQFLSNPRQSTRSRNYFNPDIYLPSLTLDWQIDAKTKLNFISSAVLGDRNSVQFLAFGDVPDTIDVKTNQYKNRQVDVDNFNSYTFDLRLIRDYNLGKLKNSIAAGIRYVNNDLHRRQLGKGTTGMDFDMTITGDFGRDLHSKTQNVSVFVENLMYLTPQFSLSPSLRMERGTTDMSGRISYLSSEKIPNSIIHNFPLFGLSAQYQLRGQNRVYGGISQAFRPVIFSDVIPLSPLDRTDPNLKDAAGYNAEIGMSGKYKTWLHYDVSYFTLRYNNRIGIQALSENGQSYNFKTNTGSSLTKGVELYAEAIPLSTKTSKLSFFTSTSYFDAAYSKGSIVVSGENKDITGNRLETVPTWISRNGISIKYKTFNATIQYSYVDNSYSDALNTVQPTSNGAKGMVPSYGILDINASLRIGQNYTFRVGVNNITDKQYFTKRPTGYPGVGVWSSDGRGINMSFGIKL
jgi:Fe(3+) dicitrate transport protein